MRILARGYLGHIYRLAMYGMDEGEAAAALLEVRDLGLWMIDEGILGLMLSQLSDTDLAQAGMRRRNS